MPKTIHQCEFCKQTFPTLGEAMLHERDEHNPLEKMLCSIRSAIPHLNVDDAIEDLYKEQEFYLSISDDTMIEQIKYCREYIAELKSYQKHRKNRKV
jgi:hypothetical protein